MKKVLFISIVLLCTINIYAQHTLKVSIKKSGDKTPLIGATAIINSIHKTAIADSFGITTFANIAAGTYQVTVSFVGLEEQEVTIQVPQPDSTTSEILLQEAEEHEEEVIVTATRTSRSIKR